MLSGFRAQRCVEKLYARAMHANSIEECVRNVARQGTVCLVQVMTRRPLFLGEFPLWEKHTVLICFCVPGHNVF